MVEPMGSSELPRLQQKRNVDLGLHQFFNRFSAMGSSELPRLPQKRNGDLGLHQFFNRFSAMNEAMNEASENLDEAN